MNNGRFRHPAGTPNFIQNIMSLKKHHIRESHERQFKGEDYQQVANDIWPGISDATEQDYHDLCAGPEPGCDCGFCAKADWRNG